MKKKFNVKDCGNFKTHWEKIPIVNVTNKNPQIKWEWRLKLSNVAPVSEGTPVSSGVQNNLMASYLKVLLFQLLQQQ